MREIKFRAWDRTKKEWCLSTNVYIEGDGTVVHCHYVSNEVRKFANCQDIEVSQLSGWLDKNGKRIYAGDIVTGYIPDSEKDEKFERGQVSMSEGMFAIYRLPVPPYNKLEDSYLGEVSNCSLNGSIQVIGNIYEKPELLNPNK
jgi:uncharacterized phage protein (TIGR01671 family)